MEEAPPLGTNSKSTHRSNDPISPVPAMDYYSKLQSRSPISAIPFPPHRTQLHPRMYSSSSSRSSQSRWWIAVAAVFILPFLFYLLAVTKRTHLSSLLAPPGPKGFGVVIDAGRRGSRVYVFEYLTESRMPFVGVGGKGVMSLKVRPGLGAFGDDLMGVRTSVEELVDFARRAVPRSEWGRTKIRLMVTDGLKGVEDNVKERILELCVGVLMSSGFLFKEEWASMVTAQEKGVYGWVAANYALGTLGGDPQETSGIIELDGASAQITFVSDEQPPTEFLHKLKLQGVGYNLYTYSTHHISQEGAWGFFDITHSSKAFAASTVYSKIVRMNPCIPKGYTQSHHINNQLNVSADSWGNFFACRSKILDLLKERKVICSNPPCGVISTFAPSFQGKSLNEEKFLYISEMFGLVPRASLLDLEASGRHYCQDDWAKLREEHFGVDEADLLKYCFSAAYMVTLLHDGIGNRMDQKSIGLMKHAASGNLDWTLGAFIMKMVDVSELEQDDLKHIAGDNLLTFAILFASLGIATIAIIFVLRWQGPQSKMIYDLEKGHYIVTHMTR